MPSRDEYSSHLERLKGRPGEKFQTHLVRGYLRRICQETNFKDIQETSVFEIGPGAGRFATQALMTGFKYSCTEITKSMRDQLRLIYENFDNARHLYDFKIPGAPKSLHNNFNAVVAIHVFEHNLNHQDARNFLVDCFDLLEPGGTVVILCPDYQSYGYMFWNVDWSHGFPPTGNRVRSILTDVGFHDVKVVGIRGIWSSPLPKILLMLVDKIFPVRSLDLLIEKLFGVEMLATGLSVAYFKRNLWATATKPLD